MIQVIKIPDHAFGHTFGFSIKDGVRVHISGSLISVKGLKKPLNVILVVIEMG
jgi:hypothetical protein